MGRGRAKAKQTKVARRLKYGVPQTDLERLQAELRGDSDDDHVIEDADVSDGDDDADDPYAHDPYAQYVDDDEDNA